MLIFAKTNRTSQSWKVGEDWQKNEMINDTINDTTKAVRQVTGNLKYPVFPMVTVDLKQKTQFSRNLNANQIKRD